MKKIVIMSSGNGPNQMFLEFVRGLFPECEVCVVLAEQDTPAVGEGPRQFSTGNKQ